MEQDDAYKAFVEFMTVLLNNVAYVAGIYPKNTFKKVRHFETAVYQSLHPGVCSWAEHAAIACGEMLRNATSQFVAIVIFNNNEPIGRFVLDVRHVPDQSKIAKTPTSSQLLQEYRACLITLLNTVTVRLDTPEGLNSSFQNTQQEAHSSYSLGIVYEGFLKDSLDPDSPWIVADGSHNSSRENVMAIRFIDAESFSMSLFYQDFHNANKHDLNNQS